MSPKSSILCKKNVILSLNYFLVLARFSKYDFWIPGEILDRNRSKKLIDNFLIEKKSSKNINFSNLLEQPNVDNFFINKKSLYNYSDFISLRNISFLFENSNLDIHPKLQLCVLAYESCTFFSFFLSKT